MAMFEITLTDRSVERIDDADAYQQEGPMTTFFATDTTHGRLDAWSIRLASFRSADVAMIRRVDTARSERPTLEVVAVNG
jgi:hypothetical protein